MSHSIRVAACHAAPVFLSSQQTTKKAIALVKEAASNNANLVIFPETFIAAFPVWSALRPPADNHEFFELMVRESIYADGPEMNSLRSEARDLGILISIGFSEKARACNATLYNSNIIIGIDGEVLVHHRKLMPTFFEKLTWAPGDGHGLRVADTSFGKIGALICGENTNPLARYTMMAQGEQLHISTWPAIWPTRWPNTGSKMEAVSEAEPGAVEPKNYDNVAANRTRAAAHCFEAKCFGALCAGVLGQDAIDAIASNDTIRQALHDSPRGATMFLDSTGAALPAFIIQDGNKVAVEFLQHAEGILYGDMDLGLCIEGKQYHDVVGGYQRFDVFQLSVDQKRQKPIHFV